MPRDNAPINITHHAETFIYLYSSLERKREKEKKEGGGGGGKLSFIYGLSG